MNEHVEGSGTWKNCEIYPLYRLWDWCESLYVAFSLYTTPGTWKNSELSPDIGFGTYKDSEVHPPEERNQVRVFPLYIGSRTWKTQSFPLLSEVPLNYKNIPNHPPVWALGRERAKQGASLRL